MASSMQPLQVSKTMNSKPQTMENKKSILLDDEENSIIFSLLGRKCLSLSTAVVQLLVTLPPQHIKWNHKCTGVVCFVKDNPKRSYYIRVYDFERKEIVWEQELYNTFEYKEQRPFFHTFEADNCMAGLNFSNDIEARHFAETVKGKLQNRRARLQENKGYNQNASFQPSVRPTDQGLTTSSKVIESKAFAKENRKQGKKKFTKEDIGTPTNFQHIHHIGWNSQTNNFEANKEIFNDTNLLTFLQSAGVTQDQLHDKSTVKFIYDFLDQHGGREKAIAEIENPPPLPPVPPVALPNPYNNNHTKSNGSHSMLHKIPTSAPPPPIPQAQAPQYVAQKPVAPSVPAPAPPPPPPPPPMAVPVAAPASSSAAPPPPPPPPPPPSFGSTVAPPPPKAPSASALSSQAAPDSHSALMEAIRKGSTLNHVEPTEAPSNNSNSSGGSGEDLRDQLMNQIRRGMALKKVEPNANKPEASKTPTSGLAGALARALQERSRALNQTDDSSDDDTHSSDDEWE